MQLDIMRRTITSSRWMAVLSLVVLGVLVGCSGKPKVSHSGFLRGDYSQLKKDPAAEGALTWLAPKSKLRQYKKFMVDPVIVHFAPDAEGTAIAPDKLKELSDYFHNQVVEKLSESRRYQVVKGPGPGVARVRIAITDIDKTTAVANIHPAMKLSGIGLGGAAMEAELVDSASGERLAAVVDSRSGGRLGVTAGIKKFGHAEQVMEHWAERFVKRLDKIHGYTK
ncbi:MAG: DUF3313 domain-containing protein [Candidatus Tectomicrobia bacterium]